MRGPEGDDEVAPLGIAGPGEPVRDAIRGLQGSGEHPGERQQSEDQDEDEDDASDDRFRLVDDHQSRSLPSS